MKYHDSVKEADHKLSLSIKQMRLWNIPATPINYAVSYEYIKDKNNVLNQAIEHQLFSGKELDGFFLEELYKAHILGQSKFRDKIIDDIEGVLSSVEENTKNSVASVKGFVSAFNANLANLQSDDKQKAVHATMQLRKAAQRIKQQQQILSEQLADTKEKALSLKVELEETRKEVYLDPLTRLYNKTAMVNQLETWVEEDPHRKIAAIVINVDHFSQFSHKFGPLISDVLLSKIAKKVSSYVDDSGVAYRSGGDEFLILFPDVDNSIADEIASKIQQGVEKLRFVSSKSGIRLPQMTVSVGVGQYNVKEEANSLIKNARALLTAASQSLSQTIHPTY